MGFFYFIQSKKEHGFRVDIKSNEPGLAHGKDSAAVTVNGPDHSDYSSSYGQRTPEYHAPEYHAPSSSPLYLSSTSNHPSSSKPYYLSSYAKSDDHSPEAYSPPSPESHHSAYPTHDTYTPPKPKYYHSPYAAKSYYQSSYPKNLAYSPKYSYYPKSVAYESPPSYSPSYSSPTYGSTTSKSPYSVSF